MTVRELTGEQLDCLRFSIFYDPEYVRLVSDYTAFLGIPDDLVYQIYDGIDFAEEDFAL